MSQFTPEEQKLIQWCKRAQAKAPPGWVSVESGFDEDQLPSFRFPLRDTSDYWAIEVGDEE